jgi:hypothetical protein
VDCRFGFSYRDNYDRNGKDGTSQATVNGMGHCHSGDSHIGGLRCMAVEAGPPGIVAGNTLGDYSASGARTGWTELSGGSAVS